MTNVEKIELGLIGFTVVVVYVCAFLLPTQVSLGLGVIWLAATAFVQSLIRDLWFLVKKNEPLSEPIEKQCFCLESLVGVSVLLIGFLLFFSGNTVVLSLDGITSSVAVLFVLMIGFLIKDLVITWKPISIRREKDHMNIVVKW